MYLDSSIDEARPVMAESQSQAVGCLTKIVSALVIFVVATIFALGVVTGVVLASL